MNRYALVALLGCIVLAAAAALFWVLRADWRAAALAPREPQTTIVDVQSEVHSARVEETPPSAPPPVERAPPESEPLDITTANMEQRTTFDTSPEFDATIGALLGGSADPAEILAYVSKILGSAELIPDSPDFRDVKVRGLRRWVLYESGKGEDCRACIERYVDPTGERESLAFEGPFPTYRLAAAPADLHAAYVRVRIDRPLDAEGFVRGSVEFKLTPDPRDSNHFIPRITEVMKYAGSGTAGRSVEFMRGRDRSWTYQSNAYPHLNADGSFEASDIDWDAGRPMTTATGDAALKVADEVRRLLKKK